MNSWNVVTTEKGDARVTKRKGKMRANTKSFKVIFSRFFQHRLGVRRRLPWSCALVYCESSDNGSNDRIPFCIVEYF